MIRVTVELLSANGPERNRLLGSAAIVNDGTGTASHGNYRAQFLGRDGRVWRTAMLLGWARNRWHPWLLVLVLLTKAVGDDLLGKVIRSTFKSGRAASRRNFERDAA